MHARPGGVVLGQKKTGPVANHRTGFSVYLRQLALTGPLIRVPAPEAAEVAEAAAPGRCP
jgi:hypothetical protein